MRTLRQIAGVSAGVCALVLLPLSPPIVHAHSHLHDVQAHIVYREAPVGGDVDKTAGSTDSKKKPKPVYTEAPLAPPSAGPVESPTTASPSSPEKKTRKTTAPAAPHDSEREKKQTPADTRDKTRVSEPAFPEKTESMEKEPLKQPQSHIDGSRQAAAGQELAQTGPAQAVIFAYGAVYLISLGISIMLLRETQLLANRRTLSALGDS